MRAERTSKCVQNYKNYYTGKMHSVSDIAEEILEFHKIVKTQGHEELYSVISDGINYKFAVETWQEDGWFKIITVAPR